MQTFVGTVYLMCLTSLSGSTWLMAGGHRYRWGPGDAGAPKHFGNMMCQAISAGGEQTQAAIKLNLRPLGAGQ